mmetsp:Transcript_46719/g.123988  ORF Transcript_46719/g.123988 Transcript_46719/m.123988 type:complete len:249 (+) Transcript_46719:729-1475(+)
MANFSGLVRPRSGDIGLCVLPSVVGGAPGRGMELWPCYCWPRLRRVDDRLLGLPVVWHEDGFTNPWDTRWSRAVPPAGGLVCSMHDLVFGCSLRAVCICPCERSLREHVSSIRGRFGVHQHPHLVQGQSVQPLRNWMRHGPPLWIVPCLGLAALGCLASHSSCLCTAPHRSFGCVSRMPSRRLCRWVQHATRATPDFSCGRTEDGAIDDLEVCGDDCPSSVPKETATEDSTSSLSDSDAARTSMRTAC